MARCIIVDDSKFMRRIIRQALQEGGHTVIDEADNGADGVKAYKFSRPDFITMDITMGGKDGIIAVREIAEFDPHARIIVISALNENTIRMHEKDIRASAFLTKPFEKEQLLDIITSIL
jgi:two-component system chemotaxis response regulator CheY